MSDIVTLSFGIDTANVALARTVAAAMAARADLPVDQLEDVRLAVDEAVSQLIADAPASGEVTCTFALIPSGLDISVEAPSASGRPPPQDTFGWTVLRALVDEVRSRLYDGRARVELHVVRAVAVDA